MPNVRLLFLASASLLVISTSDAGIFADSVIGYVPGIGFAAGFTNASAALGSPSVTTPDPFGGPVDPFNPPYKGTQLVSLGTNGSLTVKFNTPIANNPGNPYGLDFLIFGNTGFSITNGDFSGGGITDGSLFSNNPGVTRVSVSADNLTYYELNPSLAPVLDGRFPTDGAGNFQVPVNPSLQNSDFAGKNLTGIRALYAGSAGGTGFDIGWARNGLGQSVLLPAISYIRVDVLTGKSEIDGFAAVPEPAIWTLALWGTMMGWMRKKLKRIQ